MDNGVEGRQARSNRRRKAVETLLKGGLERLPWVAIVGLAGLILFMPSLYLPPLTPFMPILQTCNHTNLCSSSSTPWGVVTSIFLFDGWNNAGLYLQLLIIFGISNFILPANDVKRRSIFAISVIYASAVVSAILWLLLRPESESFGPSAVVYAFIGVTLGMSVFNAIPRGKTLKDFRGYYSNFATKALSILNILLLGLVLAFILLSPNVFLSVGPNVNVFEHGVSFLMAFALVYAYSIPKLKIGSVTQKTDIGVGHS